MTSHLNAARAQLRPDAPGLLDYDDYLAHNEWGLAFDVLVQIGETARLSEDSRHPSSDSPLLRTPSPEGNARRGKIL
jgi:hypothetical protein